MKDQPFRIDTLIGESEHGALGDVEHLLSPQPGECAAERDALDAWHELAHRAGLQYPQRAVLERDA